MILERLWAGMKAAWLAATVGFLVIFFGVVVIHEYNPSLDERWFLGSLCAPFLTGFIGFVIGFALSGKTPEQMRARVLRMLHKECSRSREGLEIGASEVIRVGRDVTLGERIDQAILAHVRAGKTRVDCLQTVCITAPEGDFHLVIPWSGTDTLPHEFYSWMNGPLAASLALKRGFLGSWSNGCWVGPHGEVDHPFAQAAEAHPIDMTSGIEWNWEKDRYKIELQWGVQAVPVTKDWYVHVMQTALHSGARSTFGLDWYVHRRRAFFLFAAGVKLDVKQERIFLFQPKSLFVFYPMLRMNTEDLMPLEDHLSRPAKLEDLL